MSETNSCETRQLHVLISKLWFSKVLYCCLFHFSDLFIQCLDCSFPELFNASIQSCPTISCLELPKCFTMQWSCEMIDLMLFLCHDGIEQVCFLMNCSFVTQSPLTNHQWHVALNKQSVPTISDSELFLTLNFYFLFSPNEVPCDCCSSRVSSQTMEDWHQCVASVTSTLLCSILDTKSSVPLQWTIGFLATTPCTGIWDQISLSIRFEKQVLSSFWWAILFFCLIQNWPCFCQLDQGVSQLLWMWMRSVLRDECTLRCNWVFSLEKTHAKQQQWCMCNCLLL